MKRYRSYTFKEGGFFTLLGLLLAIVIIFILCYIALRVYFKKPPLDKESEKLLSEQGIETSSYQAILDNARKKIKEVERKLQEPSQKR